MFSPSSMEVTAVSNTVPVEFIVLISVTQGGSSVLEGTQHCVIML